jgi:hypothetical protein
MLDLNEVATASKFLVCCLVPYLRARVCSLLERDRGLSHSTAQASCISICPLVGGVAEPLCTRNIFSMLFLRVPGIVVS